MQLRQDLIVIFLLILLSFPALSPLSQKGMFYTHDGEIHTSRLAQFTLALSQGHFPVRWEANKFFGLGYPAFNFIYVFPYYLGYAFRVIFQLSFQDIFKILLSLSFILSGITSFIYFKQLFGKLSAFCASIIYLWTPYRFANLYARGALGEALIFVFIPLLFLGPHLLKKNKFWGFVLTSLTAFFFITSHLLILEIFLPLVLIYSLIILHKDWRSFFIFLFSIFYGFLLSSFYLLPAIFDKQYTLIDALYLNIWRGHFFPLERLLRLPLPGVDTGTPFQIGVVSLIIISFFLYESFHKFIRHEKQPPLKLFFLIVGIFSLFFCTSYSFVFWEKITPLQYLVFPWRFLGVIIFCVAFLVAYFLNRIKAFSLKITFLVLVIFLSIFTTRHYLKTPTPEVINDSYYENFQDPLSSDNYFVPKGLRPDIQQITKPLVENFSGKGIVAISKRSATTLVLKTDNETETQTKFSLLYFPGWTAKIDGKKAEINSQYQDKNFDFRGLITLKIPSGQHEIFLNFGETPLRKLADFLSLIFFLGLLISLGVKLVHKNLNPEGLAEVINY